MIAEPVPRLDVLIDFHVNRYKETEKEDFDRARAYHRGDFWSKEGNPMSRKSDGSVDMLAQKNLIFAISETAVSQLLGPNPQIAAIPQNVPAQEAKGMAEGLLRYCVRKSKFRRKAALALLDAVHCKRAIFKTTWSKKKDLPQLHVINPSCLFFDPEARDVDEIKYWLECTPITVSEYNRRIREGLYSNEKDSETGHSEDIKPEGYPNWIDDDVQKGNLQKYRNQVKKVLIWEFYDLQSNQIIHYHRKTKRILARWDGIGYIPYSMFFLNHNGVDCLGLSEVQLVLNPQQSINHLLTLWKKIAYLQVPKILYDAEKITSEELDKAMAAGLSQMIPVRTQNAEEMRNFGAMFYEVPRVQMPQVVIDFINRLEQDAAWQSALLEAARGQVTGAKTATEMQFIKSEQRSRLATREGHLNEALSDVAKNMFYLSQKYMSTTKVIRVSGEKKFLPVVPESLANLEMDFEMVQYQAMQQNPAMLMETMQRLIPLLAQAPNVDMIKLFEELIKGLGLPHRIIIPEEEVLAQQQAAAQQQAMLQQAELQRSMGGAAVKAGEQDNPEGQPQVTCPAGGAQADGEAARQTPELQQAIRELAVKQGQSPPASQAA